MSHNALHSLVGMRSGTLHTLVVAHNQLGALDGVGGFPELAFLDASHNAIHTLRPLQVCACCCSLLAKFANACASAPSSCGSCSCSTTGLRTRER